MTDARMLSVLVLSPLLSVLGCGHDAPHTNRTAASAPGPSATLATAPRPDAWTTSADSVLSRHLALQYFRSDSAAELSSLDNCDDGGDNPTMQVAVAGFRILSRSPVTLDSFPVNPPGPIRGIGYTIELTSVAHFIPTWTLKDVPAFALGADTDPYVVEVGPRLDTVSIVIDQTVPQPKHWWVCNLYHEGDRFTPYWDFITRPDPGVTPVQWSPAGSSWADISRLADSIGRRRP